MPLGRILEFDAAKGFGIIKRSDGAEVFFHSNDTGTPGVTFRVGDRVGFTVSKTVRGHVATNVTPNAKIKKRSHPLRSKA